MNRYDALTKSGLGKAARKREEAIEQELLSKEAQMKRFIITRTTIKMETYEVMAVDRRDALNRLEEAVAAGGGDGVSKLSQGTRTKVRREIIHTVVEV